MQYDKDIALDILHRVHTSIEHIEERSQPYSCGDDFLMFQQVLQFSILYVCNS